MSSELRKCRAIMLVLYNKLNELNKLNEENELNRYIVNMISDYVGHQVLISRCCMCEKIACDYLDDDIYVCYDCSGDICFQCSVDLLSKIGQRDRCDRCNREFMNCSKCGPIDVMRTVPSPHIPNIMVNVCQLCYDDLFFIHNKKTKNKIIATTNYP